MGGKRIDAETRDGILSMVKDGYTHNSVAKKFGIAESTVQRIAYQNGFRSERARNEPSYPLPTDNELNRKHAEAMKEREPSSEWMEHVKPLHDRKKQLEEEIACKEAELARVKAEYRNFLATLNQLLEGVK